MLGGSSALNFYLVLYPSQHDLDNWASLGNRGWGFTDVHPYYRKISTVHLPTDDIKKLVDIEYFDCRAPNQHGPIQISFGDGYNSVNKAWVETFDKLGYKMTDDPIKGKGLGAFIHPASIDPADKSRSYATTAYYNADVAKRANLQVLTEAHVDKILLEPGTGNDDVTATGVKITTKDGQEHIVLAQKEVIVSAGTLHSPKILELSGIGGKDLLESHGLPVVVDNPNVGENLQDHILSCQSFEVNDGVPSGDVLRDPNILQAVASQYQATREGPLGCSTLCSSYMPLVDGSGPADPNELRDLIDRNLMNYRDFPARDAQYKALRETLEDPKEASVQHLFFPGQVNINPTGGTTMAQMLAPVLPDNYITVMTSLNRPFSRGSCHIRSANPTEKVAYDPRFCTHPLDLEILARHIQFVEKLVTTEPFASCLKKDGKRLPPNLNPSADSGGLEAAREIARQRCVSVFHVSGTCAMMPRDKGGVVNDRLVVHGTKNLRVVDASIFPLEPVGNIQTSVYAVAEKASDLIKEDHSKA